MADGRDAVTTLRIEGVAPGASLARSPGSTEPVRLRLRALGDEGRVRWLLDGRWVGETRGSDWLQQEFVQPGRHALTALADSGAWGRVEFSVLR